MSDDFFADLGKTLTKAGQVAAERTSSFIEATRISSQIAGEQKEVSALLEKVGSVIARRYAAGEIELGEEEKGILGEIASHKALVHDLKEKLARAKGQKVCPNCEELIDRDAAFCPKCGAPAPVQKEEGPEAEGPEASASNTVPEDEKKEASSDDKAAEDVTADETTAADAPQVSESAGGNAEEKAPSEPENAGTDEVKEESTDENAPGEADDETADVPTADFTEVNDPEAKENSAIDANFTTVDDVEKKDQEKSDS